MTLKLREYGEPQIITFLEVNSFASSSYVCKYESSFVFKE